MAKNQLVLAFFANEDAADDAVKAIKQWDKASKEIKLGSIGVLVKDDKGKVKTDKLGARHTKTGVAGGVLAAVLSGGVSLLAGVVAGGLLGATLHKGLGLSKDDSARIDGELDGGRAAVCILANSEEAQAVSAKLVELGGQAETHEVTDAALDEAAAAVAAEPAATGPAAPEASAHTDEATV
jgi:uncharacterized membrane protein